MKNSEKHINRNSIYNSKEFIQTIFKITDGNQKILNLLLLNYSDNDFESNIKYLYELGIKGNYIDIMYSVCCENDYEKFKDALFMIYDDDSLDDFINANLSISNPYPIFDSKIKRPRVVDKNSRPMKQYFSNQSEKFKSDHYKEFGLKNFGE